MFRWGPTLYLILVICMQRFLGRGYDSAHHHWDVVTIVQALVGPSHRQEKRGKNLGTNLLIGSCNESLARMLLKLVEIRVGINFVSL